MLLFYFAVFFKILLLIGCFVVQCEVQNDLYLISELAHSEFKYIFDKRVYLQRCRKPASQNDILQKK